MDRRVVLAGAVALHLAVAGAHGVTHSLVPVWLDPVASALVLATTFLGPVAGVALAWRSHPLGVPVLAVSMAGAGLSGGALHFVLANPDHVHAIPAGPWQVPFQASAVAVAATSTLGVLASAWAWRVRRETNARGGGADSASERP